MNYKTIILTACSLLIAGCGDSQPNSTADVDFAAEAQRIADSSIIVDTHIDVPMRVHTKPQDVSRATDSGDFGDAYPAHSWELEIEEMNQEGLHKVRLVVLWTVRDLVKSYELTTLHGDRSIVGAPLL